MFGIDSGELFIIALVAVVVIGPKELPRVMRTVGHWVGRARSMANQFRSGVDQMVRESEIAELEKKWREQNEAIMRANPLAGPESDWGLPPPADASEMARAVSLDKPESASPASGEQPLVHQATPRRAPPGKAPEPVKPAHAPPRAEGEAA